MIWMHRYGNGQWQLAADAKDGCSLDRGCMELVAGEIAQALLGEAARRKEAK